MTKRSTVTREGAPDALHPKARRKAVGLPALLALITALTAASGYLRELSLATTFGAGMYTDAYFIAAAIPMAAGDLLVGSVVTASIVPVFAPLVHDGATQPRDVQQAVTAVFLLVVAVSVGVALLLRAAMPTVVHAFSPGFRPAAETFTLRLADALIWLLPLNGAVLLCNVLLNAARTYVIPASAWLVVNLVFVATIHAGFPRLGADVLILGPLLGPLLMGAVLYWRLGVRGLRPSVAPDFGARPVRQVLRLARPVLLTAGVGSGLGIVMICQLLLRSFGSAFGAGVVSALGYAYRLYEVPVSLVVATAGTLVFTELSRLASSQEHARSAQHCHDLLVWGAIVLVPVVMLTAIFADPIVRVLFQRGAFTAEATQLTVEALRGFCSAIFFESILMVGLRVLYALRQPGIAVLIGAVTIAALAASALLVRQSHSVTALAGTFSGSFALAAVLVIVGIGRALGASIVPDLRDWLPVCTLAASLAVLLAFVRARLVQAGLLADGALILGYVAAYGAGFARLCPARWGQLKSRLGIAKRRMRAP